MTYEVYMLTDRVLDWIPVPQHPPYMETGTWPAAKDYAANVGLPVREANEKGFVTREYHPAVEF